MKQILFRLALCLSMIPLSGGSGERPLRRLVVAGGGLSETVAALQRTDLLVGVDLTSTYPETLSAIPRIGYLRTLSAEGILALRPDHVLLAEESGPPVVIRQLEATVPVTRVPSTPSVEGVRQRILEVGRVIGEAAAANRLLAEVDESWRVTEARVASLSTHPRVLFILAHGGGGPLVAGHGTAADAMIRLSGGINAVAALEGYKPLTPEAALEARPDWLLITDQSLEQLGGEKVLLSNPALKLTPAGKAGRIHAMESLFLLGFGPRLPLAVRALADRWQPSPSQSAPH